ncbi:Hypothetical protein SaO82_1959 [Staphylococcus aureus]|nr:Hypothetical protein SaO82_1959 [Staphylococcus aureus]
MTASVQFDIEPERWLGEVKTFESDETRKERNEFSRAK